MSANPKPGRILGLAVSALAGALGVALLVGAWRMDLRWFARNVLPPYCATYSGDAVHLACWRGGAGLVGVGLLLVASRLGRFAARNATRAAAASWGSVIGAVFLALVCGDLVLRAAGKRPAPPFVPKDLPHGRADPTYGWACAPGATMTVDVGDRRVTYAVDSFGNRAAHQEDVPDLDAPSILFAGESVAFGVGVAYDETYAAIVGRDLGVQFVNLAVPGYANDQAYLRTKDLLPKFSRPIAIVTLVVPGQMERDVTEWRPRLALRDGTLELVAPPSPWIRDSPVRMIARALVPYHGTSAIDVARAIFEATAREARARGAYPLFVFTHFAPWCLLDEHGTSTLEHDLFDGTDVPHVHAEIAKDEVLAANNHPDARAHRSIALAIERALVDARITAR